MKPGEVERVTDCRLVVGARKWAYAEAHRPEIVAEFERQRALNSGYFNGLIQILVDHSIADGMLRAEFATSDFASFVYWRSKGHPDQTVRDGFGCAVVRSAEGHVLLGVQAGGNLNAGRAYCPSGFIDEADIRADRTIDIDGSTVREIEEETGLEMAALRRVPGYLLVAAGSSIAICVEYHSAMPAEALRATVLTNLARQTEPELRDIIMVDPNKGLGERLTAPHVPPLLRALI